MDSSLPGPLSELQIVARQIATSTKSHRGWRPQVRERFGHVPVSEIYGALLDKLISQGTHWLDVGGGHSVLPTNPSFAEALARRAERLVVVDPSANVHKNHLAHERHQCLLEDYKNPGNFHVATLRMVAEHVTHPTELTRKLAELIRPGGLVAVLTPNKWSPASIGARLIPNSLHPMFTKLMSGRAEEDTFPTVYRMNTRAQLRGVFSQCGFAEERFWWLDDCSVLQQLKSLFVTQLAISRVCGSLGLPFPENVLLGVYRRLPA